MIHRLLRAALLLALGAAALWLLPGCAALDTPQAAALRDDWAAGVPRHVELTRVPFFPQLDYQSGPAALAMALVHSGVPVHPDTLADEVWLPSRHGSLQLEMLATPRRYGRVSYRLQPRFADLLREVAAGHPVVVLQDLGPLWPQWHYAVVNGFDSESGTVYLRSGLQPRQQMAFAAFERSWLQGNHWAMVVQRPDDIPATASEQRWLQALLGLARGGDVEATVQGYAAALARWPESLPAAIGLANQLNTRGSLGEAADVLDAALRRHPQSTIVLNNLAQTLSDLGRNGEALTLITRASDPRSPFASEIRATRALIQERLRGSAAR